MNLNIQQEQSFAQLIEPSNEYNNEYDCMCEYFHEPENLYNSKMRLNKLKTQQSLSSSLIQCFKQLKVKSEKKHKNSIHKFKRYSKFKWINRLIQVKANINNKVQLNSQYEEISFNIISEIVEQGEQDVFAEQLY